MCLVTVKYNVLNILTIISNLNLSSFISLTLPALLAVLHFLIQLGVTGAEVDLTFQLKYGKWPGLFLFEEVGNFEKLCLTNPCLFTSEIIEGYFEGIVHKSRVSTDQTFRREF